MGGQYTGFSANPLSGRCLWQQSLQLCCQSRWVDSGKSGL